MKKVFSLLLSVLIASTLCACSNFNLEEVIQEEEHHPTQTKESNDEHYAYIKDYVGRNCASIGYSPSSDIRVDYLGKGHIFLRFETADGSYIDVDNEEQLGQYVVVAQNIDPNTEARIEFMTNDEGEESFLIPKWQSIEEIVLQVKKIDEDVKFEHKLTRIKQPKDQYKYYMPDFVGRNLATCGYLVSEGDLRFSLGNVNIRFAIVTDDGSYVNLDEETIKEYVVYDQGVEPNTEINVEYQKDSEGNDIYFFATNQTYNEIDLYVKRVE